MRFPIPDLRSDQERGPWFKKSLQKEVLYLELEDLEVKTEFTGGSSPEQTKMELTFRELVGMCHPAAKGQSSLKTRTIFDTHHSCTHFSSIFTGKFQEKEDQPAGRFLRVSHTMDGNMTISDSGKFDWPRYCTSVHVVLYCFMSYLHFIP